MNISDFGILLRDDVRHTVYRRKTMLYTCSFFIIFRKKLIRYASVFILRSRSVERCYGLVVLFSKNFNFTVILSRFTGRSISFKFEEETVEETFDRDMPLRDSKLCITQWELEKATENWQIRNVIKSGKFTTFYKGILNGTEVAVKKVKPITNTYMQENLFKKERNEMEILPLLKHKNIISLCAYSLDGETPCIAYPYMKNGSLRDKLKEDKSSLSWIQRDGIARGIIDGVSYLHLFFQKGIIHGSMSSAHILLDEHLNPAITDFGLARSVSSYSDIKFCKITTDNVQPYLPNPYVLKNNLSLKSDVFACGVILFELATGLPPYDEKHNTTKSLVDFVKKDSNYRAIKDKRGGKDNLELFDKLINVGIFCSSRVVDIIPPIDKVQWKFNNYGKEEIVKKVEKGSKKSM